MSQLIHFFHTTEIVYLLHFTLFLHASIHTLIFCLMFFIISRTENESKALLDFLL